MSERQAARPDFETLDQLVHAGRAALDGFAAALIESGSGEGVTVRRNHAAYDRIALRPRVLRDVREVDTGVSFLGHPLAAPVMLAPVGPLALFDKHGAVAVARAAAAFGTVAFIGMSSSPAYSEAIAAAGTPQFFQMYVGGDRGWMDELVGWIEADGCLGICVTVDNPVPARRDRMIELGDDWKEEWSGGFPNLMGLPRDRSSQAAFSWADLAWLVERTELPIILKGVLDPGDATHAATVGVQAIYVSNHGGRVLDHAPATIDTVAAIADALGDSVELILDGGIMRGTDICKALGLGARAVLIGRLQCWALAAAGSEGVVRALELLELEFATTMALLGCRSVAELSAAHLNPTLAV